MNPKHISASLKVAEALKFVQAVKEPKFAQLTKDIENHLVSAAKLLYNSESVTNSDTTKK